MSKSLENLKSLNLAGVTAINMRVAKIKETSDVIEYVNNSPVLHFGDIAHTIIVSNLFD